VIQFLEIKMTSISVSLPAKEVLKPIVQKFGIRFIVLFGSVVRGTTNAESDIDLGVLTNRPLTFNQQLKLWGALSPLFNIEVDLVVLNHANPVLAFEVASTGDLLFEDKPNTWDNWKSFSFRQYWDTGKFRSDLRRFITRRAEEMSHVAAE
jgi:predicted nucleotidyltransferase